MCMFSSNFFLASTKTKIKFIFVESAEQGRSDGGYMGIHVYTLPKSVQVNFLRRRNDARMVIEHEY